MSGLVMFFLISMAASPQWLSVGTPHFEIRYMDLDARTGTYLARHVEGVVQRVVQRTGLSPDTRITVIVAHDMAGFRNAIPGEVRAPYWADGLAVPAQHLILLKSPRILPGVDPLDVFVHEYTHVLLGQRSPEEDIPTWLHEGLAMYVSQEWGWARSVYMSRAVLSGRMIPLTELERGFPKDLEEARVAYAESYYLIAFLRASFGRESLHRFIRLYQKGFGFREALRRATGVKYKDLEERWKRSMTLRFSIIPLVTGAGTFWVVMALLLLLAYRRKKREAQAQLDAWTEQEAWQESISERDVPPELDDSRT